LKSRYNYDYAEEAAAKSVNANGAVREIAHLQRLGARELLKLKST
jgi:hypothetical protein